MSLKLIKLREEHLETVRRWRMMPEVTKYMYTDPQISSEDQRKWFEKISKDSSRIYWVISFDDKENNTTTIDVKTIIVLKKAPKLSTTIIPLPPSTASAKPFIPNWSITK